MSRLFLLYFLQKNHKFINTLILHSKKKEIQLRVESKKLTSGENIIFLKSLIVSDKLLDSLGLESKGVVVRKEKVKKQPTLRELIISMDKRINQRIDKLDRRLSVIEELPIIQKAIQESQN